MGSPTALRELETHCLAVAVRDAVARVILDAPPHARATLERFLELGGQTRTGERRVGALALEAALRPAERAAARD